MARANLCRVLRPQWIVLAAVLAAPLVAASPVVGAPPPVPDTALPAPQPDVSYRVRGANDRLQMTVNTSRILTIGQKIPRVQVNDPKTIVVNPLSPIEVQISAKMPGVTQVNLWGEDEKIYALEVVVFADAEQLNMIIRHEFSNSTVRALALPTGGVLLTGYVDQPEHISRIVQLAEQFYGKDKGGVLNNMTVGGVQLVHLHVKLMEVSRTKLRTMGFDWAKITNGNVVVSQVSGILTSGLDTSATSGTTSGAEKFAFGITNGSSAFFGLLEALRQDNMMKILADPTLVTISGRSAFFHVGGEFPILVPQGIGAVSIEYKKYGTRVDFVPIVLGNGKIHLDVRPEVSEIDMTRTVTVGSSIIPGIRIRTAETGVEMTAGQTLAIAGLIQSRDEAENRGLPWVSELPYVGALFRRVQHTYNEIELLILVTPELVDGMDCQEVPPCGPGMNTTRPGDFDFYLRGHLEVPNCCPSCNGAGCASCSHGQLPPPATTEPGLILEGARPASPKPAPAGGAASEPTRGITIQQVTTGGGVKAIRTAKPDNPQNRSSRDATAAPAPSAANPAAAPAFIGPTGYQGK